MGKNINTIKKNTKSLLQAGTEVGLEVNTEETKCACVYAHVCLTTKIQNKTII